jgi:N utilization substance protein B
MTKPYLRHAARALAIQAIYDWQIHPLPVEALLARFLSEANKKFDQDYFERLIRLTLEHQALLQELITPYLDRAFDEVSQVELAILRIGACELKFFLDVPYRVVLNEALELTKKFGSPNSHKFINGVLDKLALVTREEEIKLLAKKTNDE